MGHVLDIHAFGRNPDIDSGTLPEDVWDRGGIWLAPTTGRQHNIVSSSPLDSSPAGDGARTMRVTGLKTWGSMVSFEDVVLNGVNNVLTVESYVIIHDMEVLTFGVSGENAGVITATALVDLTVTAQIAIGTGHSHMAILGVPRGLRFDVTRWAIGFNRISGVAASADVQFRINRKPDRTDSGFVVAHHMSAYGSGSSHVPHNFRPPMPVHGPAIVKITVENVSANNTDLSSSIDGIFSFQ